MDEAIGSPPLKRRRAIRKGSTTTLSDLPDPMICNILSRLPLKSIFRCKAVCKTWRNLLLEPYFAKSHFSRSPRSLIFYRRTNSSHFGILELHDQPLSRFRRRNAIIKFRTEIHTPDEMRMLDIAGSCNGSICLYYLDYLSGDTVVFCNPVRGHYFTLPKPSKTPPESHVPRYGFGYSPSTDQFKVLRFMNKISSPRVDCDIYTIGKDDNAWRSTGGTLLGESFPSSFRSFVFLKAALHWKVYISLDDPALICYFDMEKEEFGNLALPSHLGDPGMDLGVVDNCLYICDDYASSVSCVKIWVMKDYGDVGSFSLQWVIQRSFLYCPPAPLKPVKTFKDGTLLITFGNKTLASYNPTTGVLKQIKYHGVRFWSEFVDSVPSLLPHMDAIR